MADESLAKTARLLACVLFGIWAGAMLYVALRYLSGALTERPFHVDIFASALYITWYFWAPWIFTAPLVAALARRLPFRPDDWIRPMAANVGLCLTISLLQGLVMSYYYFYFGTMSAAMAQYKAWQHTGHFLFGDDIFLLNTIAYAVLAAALNIGKFHELLRQKDLDAARLGENLAQLQLQTLRMQINPHFLFNSLNAVSVLVRKGERESAIEMIRKMGSFMRRTLDESADQWVTLDRELAMVEDYLAIARFRFGERLRIRQSCDPEACDIAIPSMLLQPLVENAVVHGIAEHAGDCELEVSCRLRGDRLSICVRDNGAGSLPYGDASFKEGIGMRNVRQRLEQFYRGEHSFLFESQPGSGACVTIEIAARPADVSARGRAA
jgi:two-component system, LytTR family, sensor kinase